MRRRILALVELKDLPLLKEENREEFVPKGVQRVLGTVFPSVEAEIQEGVVNVNFGPLGNHEVEATRALFIADMTEP